MSPIKHMFGSKKPDALGAKHARFGRVVGGIGVGADLQPSDGIADFQEIMEQSIFLGSVDHG